MLIYLFLAIKLRLIPYLNEMLLAGINGVIKLLGGIVILGIFILCIKSIFGASFQTNAKIPIPNVFGNRPKSNKPGLFWNLLSTIGKILRAIGRSIMWFGKSIPRLHNAVYRFLSRRGTEVHRASIIAKMITLCYIIVII